MRRAIRSRSASPSRFPTDLESINRTRIELFRLVGGVIVPLPGQWKAEADVS